MDARIEAVQQGAREGGVMPKAAMARALSRSQSQPVADVIEAQRVGELTKSIVPRWLSTE